MNDELTASLKAIKDRLDLIDARLTDIDNRVGGITVRVSRIPSIDEAITVVQRDMRMVRAAIEDMGVTRVTTGEITAMHTDIDRVMAQVRELGARVATLEERE